MKKGACVFLESEPQNSDVLASHGSKPLFHNIFRKPPFLILIHFNHRPIICDLGGVQGTHIDRQN